MIVELKALTHLIRICCAVPHERKLCRGLQAMSYRPRYQDCHACDAIGGIKCARKTYSGGSYWKPKCPYYRTQACGKIAVYIALPCFFGKRAIHLFLRIHHVILKLKNDWGVRVLCIQCCRGGGQRRCCMRQLTCESIEPPRCCCSGHFNRMVILRSSSKARLHPTMMESGIRRKACDWPEQGIWWRASSNCCIQPIASAGMLSGVFFGAHCIGGCHALL